MLETDYIPFQQLKGDVKSKGKENAGPLFVNP